MSLSNILMIPGISDTGPSVTDKYEPNQLSTWEYGMGLIGDDAYVGVFDSAAIRWGVMAERLNLAPGEYLFSTLAARLAFTQDADHDQLAFCVYEKSGSNLIEVLRVDLTSQKTNTSGSHNATFNLGDASATLVSGKDYFFGLALRGPATRAFNRPGWRRRSVATDWPTDEWASHFFTSGVATMPTTFAPTFATTAIKHCYLLTVKTKTRIVYTGNPNGNMIPRRTDGVSTIKVDTFVGDATARVISLVDTTAGAVANRLVLDINHTSENITFSGTAQSIPGQTGDTFDFLIQTNGTAANLLYLNRTDGLAAGGENAVDIRTISHHAKQNAARGGSYTMGASTYRFITNTGGGTISAIQIGWEPVVVYGDSMAAYTGRLGQYLPTAFTHDRMHWRAQISGNALTTTSPGNHTAGHLRYKHTTIGSGDICEIRDAVLCFAMFGLNDISRIGTNPAQIPIVTDDYFLRIGQIVDDLLANGNHPLLVGLAPYHHNPNASTQEATTIRNWINQYADLATAKRIAWLTPWWDLVEQATANDSIPLIRAAYTDDGGTHINAAAAQVVVALIAESYESGIVGGPWPRSARRYRQ